jgi:hypothetical protein
VRQAKGVAEFMDGSLDVGSSEFRRGQVGRRIKDPVTGRIGIDGHATAVPELLRVLELSGGIVTGDAMGCQKKITRPKTWPRCADWP